MSYDEPHDDPYDSHDTEWSAEAAIRWPLDWHGQYPRERWLWFEQLWADVCALRDRYRLPVRSLLVGAPAAGRPVSSGLGYRSQHEWITNRLSAWRPAFELSAR